MAGSQVPPFWQRQVRLQFFPKVPTGQAGGRERGKAQPVAADPRAARSEGEESFFARCPPASLTLVTEDAGPARRTLAARLLRVARGSVLAVLAGQAAVGAERVLQADCNEKRCG